jgi:hypothetical protein
LVTDRLAPSEPRAQLRLRSLAWAVLGGSTALGLSLLPELALPSQLGQAVLPGLGAWPGPWLEQALRAGGCGFFYGLLAFHLQRVDPGDSHLQAGLVGAVCGIRSLAAPLVIPSLQDSQRAPALAEVLPAAMMELAEAWLPLWWPVVGSALVLHLAQRLLPPLRP